MSDDAAKPPASATPAAPPALPERVSHFAGGEYCPPFDAPAPAEYEAKITAANGRDPRWGILPHLDHIREQDDINDSELAASSHGNPGPDWEQIFHDLDGEPLHGEHVDQGQAANMAKALAALIGWLLNVNRQDHRALQTIGRRTVAMAWVINPDQFGKDTSLSTLAKALGYQSAVAISPDAAEFSRVFGIRNRFQHAHNWRKKGGKNAASATN